MAPAPWPTDAEIVVTGQNTSAPIPIGGSIDDGWVQGTVAMVDGELIVALTHAEGEAPSRVVVRDRGDQTESLVPILERSPTTLLRVRTRQLTVSDGPR